MLVITIIATMISIELWRARIGLFKCSRSAFRGPADNSSASCDSHLLKRGAVLLLLVVVITRLVLLSAGDIERNPGPISKGDCHTLLSLHFCFTNVDAKPKPRDLQHMSYTSEDGKTVHFRLMDRIKPRVTQLAIALEFPLHIRANLKTEHAPVCYLLDEWLRGGNVENDQRPLTWGTLIKALKSADLTEEVTVLNKMITVTKPEAVLPRSELCMTYWILIV